MGSGVLSGPLPVFFSLLQGPQLSLYPTLTGPDGEDQSERQPPEYRICSDQINRHFSPPEVIRSGRDANPLTVFVAIPLPDTGVAFRLRPELLRSRKAVWVTGHSIADFPFLGNRPYNLLERV